MRGQVGDRSTYALLNTTIMSLSSEHREASPALDKGGSSSQEPPLSSAEGIPENTAIFLQGELHVIFSLII